MPGDITVTGPRRNAVAVTQIPRLGSVDLFAEAFADLFGDAFALPGGPFLSVTGPVRNPLATTGPRR